MQAIRRCPHQRIDGGGHRGCPRGRRWRPDNPAPRSGRHPGRHRGRSLEVIRPGCDTVRGPGPLAQLARAFASHAKGHWFKSSTVHAARSARLPSFGPAETRDREASSPLNDPPPAGRSAFGTRGAVVAAPLARFCPVPQTALRATHPRGSALLIAVRPEQAGGCIASIHERSKVSTGTEMTEGLEKALWIAQIAA